MGIITEDDYTKVVIKFGPDEYDKVDPLIDWCNEVICNGIIEDSQKWCWEYGDDNADVIFHFLDEKYAILFKLRWE